MQKCEEAMFELLQQKKSNNRRKNTPLHFAVFNGHLRLIINIIKSL